MCMCIAISCFKSHASVGTLNITGKTPCKYGPVFAPYLHDWTLYGINTVQNGSVFTWGFSCACYQSELVFLHKN